MNKPAEKNVVPIGDAKKNPQATTHKEVWSMGGKWHSIYSAIGIAILIANPDAMQRVRTENLMTSGHKSTKTTPARGAYRGSTLPRKAPPVKKRPEDDRAKLSTLALELLTVLTYKRAQDSVGERRLIKLYIEPIPGIREDLYGNYWVQVGDDRTTMFTAHTDTVHSTFGKEKTKYKQRVIYDPVADEAYKTDNQCLGADDGTGVWLMRNMILAEVPGLYYFFRAEEGGGKGSRWMLKNHKDRVSLGALSNVDEVKRCISFDRKGFTDVITFQHGQRCCSEVFAQALSDALNEGKSPSGGEYKPDDTGTFTDSASLTTLIPECTNISVGYKRQHSGQETQSIGFALRLLEKLKVIKWTDLPTDRDPTKVESKYASYGVGGYDDWGDYGANRVPATRTGGRSKMGTPASSMFWAEVERLVQNNPDLAAELLWNMAPTCIDLAKARVSLIKGDTP